MLVKFKKGSRARTLSVLLFLVIGVVIVRLFQIQILDHDMYVERANEEHIKRLVIPAKRGRIYVMDRDRPTQLVMNETVYTLFADPMIVTDANRAERVIRRVAGGNLVTDLRGALSQVNTRYQVLATNLSRRQAEMIREERLTGIGFQETTRRVYPEGALASQTLGFVNRDGIGQYGVEGALDDRLRGTDGLLESVTDISAIPLTIGNRNINEPAVDGDDIVLTIDRNVQAYTEKALRRGIQRTGATDGSVIVMDPNNGRIMAMANYPTYNQAEFGRVRDTRLFSNPVVTDPYEPGSVIKVFTLAAGIDTGTITPRSTFYNTDSIRVGDRTIGNAFTGRLGRVDMQTVLDLSLNTGVVTVLERMGGGSINRQARNTLYEYFHDKFGFGVETGIELHEELGRVISPQDEEGNAVRYSNMTFGQGMDVTMLQVARGFSAVINGGDLPRATIVRGVMRDGQLREYEPEMDREGVIRSSTSNTLRQMLVDGRATIFGIHDRRGHMVGGKTGTSETLVDGVYVKTSTIGTYLGFGGDDRPRYVIMVRVHGDGLRMEGGPHAQPIFTDISNWLIDYLRLQPRR